MNTNQKVFCYTQKRIQWSLSISHRMLLLAVIIGICTIATFFTLAAAETNPRTQELRGFLEDDQGVVYTLKDLKKGDTVYAYMTSTSGNLDPLLGVFRKESNPDFRYEEVLKSIASSERNLVEVFSLFADEKFVVWDDDSGSGYDAKVKFLIPADGNYAVFAGSMITNLALDMFKPTFTFGSYHLLFGINAPTVTTAKGDPADKVIATIGFQNVKPSSHVQKFNLKLIPDKQFTFHPLRNFRPGDTLYVRLAGTNNQPLPRLFLTDIGGKPLLFGKTGEPANSAVFSYQFQEGGSGFNISLNANGMNDISKTGEYLLVAGINAPEVLRGDDVTRGVDVFKNSHNVKIGLSIDQIVNVDQQRENFSVVGSLQMIWQDPDLAFSPDKCHCAVKMMDLNDLKTLTKQNDILFPAVTFFNQQGNRWSESQQVFIEPSGRTTYIERFTITLQAPDFDFLKYPFDQQKFKVQLDLNVPTEVFTFIEIENPGSPLGDQLGEEEWSVVTYSQGVTEVPYGKNLTNSRFTTTLEMNRHLNYYIFRIILPLFLIISVSWVIFFLKDYGKQLEVASGNLLVFVAFNFTISNDLPRLGYLTFLDRMIITSFCCAALVVFISVCQKRLEAKGRVELASYIDKVVLTFYPLIYVILVSVEYFYVISETSG